MPREDFDRILTDIDATIATLTERRVLIAETRDVMFPLEAETPRSPAPTHTTCPGATIARTPKAAAAPPATKRRARTGPGKDPEARGDRAKSEPRATGDRPGGRNAVAAKEREQIVEILGRSQTSMSPQQVAAALDVADFKRIGTVLALMHKTGLVEKPEYGHYAVHGAAAPAHRDATERAKRVSDDELIELVRSHGPVRAIELRKLLPEMTNRDFREYLKRLNDLVEAGTVVRRGRGGSHYAMPDSTPLHRTHDTTTAARKPVKLPVAPGRPKSASAGDHSNVGGAPFLGTHLPSWNGIAFDCNRCGQTARKLDAAFLPIFGEPCRKAA